MAGNTPGSKWPRDSNEVISLACEIFAGPLHRLDDDDAARHT
jgi:hypothetical protein